MRCTAGTRRRRAGRGRTPGSARSRLALADAKSVTGASPKNTVRKLPAREMRCAHRGFGQRGGDQRRQPVGVGVERGVHDVVGGAQGGQPRGHRHRVTRERAGLVHRAQRGEAFHHLGAATECRGGQAAAHHLAEGEQVGIHRIDAVPTTSADPESGHHLVHDQQRTVLGGDPAQCGVVAGRGRHRAHVARAGLGDDAGDLLAVRREGLLDGGDVVVGQHDGVGGSGPGDTRRGRQPQRRDAGAGVGQQRVDCGRGSSRRI